VTELTWLLDPATGALVVEGLTMEEASALAGDLLPAAWEVNCARPLATSPLPAAAGVGSLNLRVARIYHGSVVDGPGRRSVVQLQGCPLRCPGCYVPETHDSAAGVPLGVAEVVAALLDPAGEPRDGITVLGGEPFFQAQGLAVLLRALRRRGLHTVVYSGYTLEALAGREEPYVHEALRLTDLLIDGPFVRSLAADAGQWRGSRNQRLVLQPARALVACDAYARSAHP
jgi:anaerobic ribonucleoside-triphosphate reductase activating protein